MLVLETKGQPDQQTQAKRRTLQQWTQAVNQHGGFGHWVDAVSTDPGDVKDILAKRAGGECYHPAPNRIMPRTDASMVAVLLGSPNEADGLIW